MLLFYYCLFCILKFEFIVFRAQISGTLKRKAFEDAGLTCVPMRKIQGALSPVETPAPKQQVASSLNALPLHRPGLGINAEVLTFTN